MVVGRWKLVYFLFVFVVARSFQLCFMKRLVDQLGGVYTSVLVALISPILGFFLAFFFVCGYILYMRNYNNDKSYDFTFLLPYSRRGTNVRDGEAPPMTIFAIYAGLEYVEGIFFAASQVYLSQSVASLLFLLDKPFTMLLSMCWVGARYISWHYVGCLIVLLAVGGSVLPKILNMNCETPGALCITSYKSVDGWKDLNALATVSMYFVFTLGVFCSSLHNVYMMKKVKAFDIDAVYFYWMCVLLKLGFSGVLFPIIFIPWPGVKVPKWHNFGSDFSATISCLGGVNTKPTDHCDHDTVRGWYWILVYCILQIVFKSLFVHVVKLTSSMVATLSAALGSLFSIFLSQYKLILGSSANSVNPTDWIMFALAFFGFGLYSSTPEYDKYGRMMHQTHLREVNNDDDINQVLDEEEPMLTKIRAASSRARSP